jgi:hypothetical protein
VISLLPSHDETLVLPLSAKEVFTRLSKVTRSDLAAVQDKSILFSGWIKQDRFRISMKVNRPNNFLTLIKGRMESTSSGCLIFIDYQLFPTTRLFVSFWLLLSCMFSIAVGFQYSSFWYSLGGLAIAIGIYLITWSNFNLQLTLARAELLKILE